MTGEQTRNGGHIRCAVPKLCGGRESGERDVLLQSSKWRPHLC